MCQVKFICSGQNESEYKEGISSPSRQERKQDKKKQLRPVSFYHPSVYS